MQIKSIAAASALALVGFAAPAFAQSSVTAFGVVDLAMRSVKNNTTQDRLDASGLSSSRLGFRGIEDLGGGLRAGFWLEGAINADDGNASGFNWQRRSTVSIMGGFGEVRLGRDKTPSGLNWDDLDPFANTGSGASGRLAGFGGTLPTGGAYTNFQRANNSIAYFTPGTSGFFGHVAVAAGEATPGNKYTGLRVGYRDGALLVSGSYGRTEVTSAVDAKLYDIGATYDLKVVKLFGMYASLDIANASQTNYLLGLSAPLGPVELRGSYQVMDGKEAINNQEAKKLSLGGSYNFSRRTAAYANYAEIKNTNTAYTVATGSALSRGAKSSAYEIGLRHSF